MNKEISIMNIGNVNIDDIEDVIYEDREIDSLKKERKSKYLFYVIIKGEEYLFEFEEKPTRDKYLQEILDKLKDR